MPLKVQLKRTVVLIVSVVAVVVAIFGANLIHSKQKCKEIKVVIESENKNLLVKEYDVQNVVTGVPSEDPQGKPFSRINLKAIERKVLANPLIKSCQAHQDLSGQMTITVQEHTPIARILSSKSPNHTQYDSYLVEDGSMIGLSPHHTERVLLISGAYFVGKKSLKDAQSKSIIELIKFIRDDEFWKSQITQLIVEKDGGVTLIPEFGSHFIELGLAIDLEAKFKKIKILYKEILPIKGWDFYKKISVKYKNQIVCE